MGHSFASTQAIDTVKECLKYIRAGAPGVWDVFVQAKDIRDPAVAQALVDSLTPLNCAGGWGSAAVWRPVSSLAGWVWGLVWVWGRGVWGGGGVWV